MELIQPYSKYIWFGVIAIIAIAIIIWLGAAVIVLRNTKGIPLEINNFFDLITDNKIDEAYSSTSDNFRSQISKPQLNKWVKTYKFKQYYKTRLDVPQMQTANDSTLKATLILKSGREIPMQFTLVRINREWKIDGLKIT